MSEDADKRDKRSLERDCDEIEKHLKNGRERIVGSYLDDYEVGQAAENGDEIDAEWVERKLEEYDEPPHESILGKSMLYIEEGLDQREDEIVFGDEPTITQDLYYVFISIGTEYLLNGIILVEAPSFFKEETELDYKRSPPLRKMIEHLDEELLPRRLEEEQRFLVKDTLELVKIQRNNFVHLPYHSSTHSNHPGVIHHVLAYLVQEYTDHDQMGQRLAECADVEHLIGEDYSPLPLD